MPSAGSDEAKLHEHISKLENHDCTGGPSVLMTETKSANELVSIPWIAHSEINNM